MFDIQLPLSSSDFSSGRFDEVAKFVYNNWPYNNIPTHEEALDIVAKTIGYKNYEVAKLSSTVEVSTSYSIFFRFEENFLRLGYAPNPKWPDDSMDPASRLRSLLNCDFLKNEFVKSWPLNLLNRWNYENKPCSFGLEFVRSLEPFFETAWSNNLSNFNGFQTTLKHTSSAASVVATLASSLQLDALVAKNIAELLDDEVIEAIFNDAMSAVFREIFILNDSKAKSLIEHSGLSITDLLALPRDDSGFPGLFDHMREYLRNVILSRPAISLYTIERKDSSFYYEPRAINRDLVKPDDKYSVQTGEFLFSIERDDLESDRFRTYTWRSQLQDERGSVLAHAMGTYIAGSATKSASGFSLISAADEMCDDDVEVIDIVLTQLQSDILHEYGKTLDKGAINTKILFKHGNLVSILQWERSLHAQPGSGVDLINHTVDRLKKKFKRNMFIATIIHPYQYNNDAWMHSAIENQRQVDIGKIRKQLFKAGAHQNVLIIYTKGHVRAEGDSAFLKYCGENYHGI